MNDAFNTARQALDIVEMEILHLRSAMQSARRAASRIEDEAARKAILAALENVSHAEVEMRAILGT